MATNNPQRSLQQFLLAPTPNGLGLTIEQAKRMVYEWKEFGIDMSKGDVIHKLVEHNEVLLTMATYSNFGMLRKILEVKNTLQET